MRVTIKDVAKLANVSTATVSMALNGKGNIKPETVAKILQAAKLLNYYPNLSARSLITKKSNCIGLIVPEIINPYYSTLVTQINKAAEAHGYSLLMNISDNHSNNEKRYMDMLISKNVEGIIIIPTNEKNPDLSHLYHLKKIGLPFVFCTSPYIGINESCIMSDVKEGSYLLVKYLLGKGLRKIFMIAAHLHLYYAKARTEGYILAYNEFNLPYDNNWIIESNLDYMAGYESTLSILKHHPDAIIAMNDYTALGIMKALYDQNIDVPNQISVAGYDDLIYATALPRALTTVYHSLEMIGEKTVDVLIDKINGSSDVVEILIPPKLQLRQTTI